MSAEIEFESIPGLPHDLPPGERVLWQGRPQWRALARETFKLPWLATYFAVFAAARVIASWRGHEGAAGLLKVLAAVGLAVACLGLLTAFAWLHARMTIYTITTRRVVMRIGIALPMSWNLPFKRIASADVTQRKGGDGDIVLRLTAPNRIAWLHLWPHAQPWHVVNTRPSLRAIADPVGVSALLAAAVREWAATESAPVLVATPEVFSATTPPSSAPVAVGGALSAEAAR